MSSQADPFSGDGSVWNPAFFSGRKDSSSDLIVPNLPESPLDAYTTRNETNSAFMTRNETHGAYTTQNFGIITPSSSFSGQSVQNSQFSSFGNFSQVSQGPQFTQNSVSVCLIGTDLSANLFFRIIRVSRPSVVLTLRAFSVVWLQLNPSLSRQFL